MHKRSDFFFLVGSIEKDDQPAYPGRAPQLKIQYWRFQHKTPNNSLIESIAPVPNFLLITPHSSSEVSHFSFFFFFVWIYSHIGTEVSYLLWYLRIIMVPGERGIWIRLFWKGAAFGPPQGCEKADTSKKWPQSFDCDRVWGRRNLCSPQLHWRSTNSAAELVVGLVFHWKVFCTVSFHHVHVHIFMFIFLSSLAPTKRIVNTGRVLRLVLMLFSRKFYDVATAGTPLTLWPLSVTTARSWALRSFTATPCHSQRLY